MRTTLTFPNSLIELLKLNMSILGNFCFNQPNEVETLFREQGYSAQVVNLLNTFCGSGNSSTTAGASNTKDAWHFVTKSNIAFFLTKEDLPKIENDAIREKIEAYRTTYSDKYKKPI